MHYSPLHLFAFFVFSSNLAIAQTYDLCDCRPTTGESLTHHFQSAIHGYPEFHSFTTEQLISDQNQFLELEFRKIASHREAMGLRMSELQNRTAKSLAEMNAAIHELATSNQNSFEKLAQSNKSALERVANLNQSSLKKLAEESIKRDQKLSSESNARFRRLAQELNSRDQKIDKALRARDQEISSDLNRAFQSYGTLSKDLVGVIKKSTETTKSVIEVVGKTDGRFADIQKQIRKNSALIEQGLKSYSHQMKFSKAHQEETEGLFDALDQDLEAIRNRISRMEKSGSTQYKKLSGKLDVLEEIESKLDQLKGKQAQSKSKKSQSKGKQNQNRKNEKKKKK